MVTSLQNSHTFNGQNLAFLGISLNKDAFLSRMLQNILFFYNIFLKVSRKLFDISPSSASSPQAVPGTNHDPGATKNRTKCASMYGQI